MPFFSHAMSLAVLSFTLRAAKRMLLIKGLVIYPSDPRKSIPGMGGSISLTEFQLAVVR